MKDRKQKKIIYVRLQGRIGNQLFIYSFAKKLLKEYNGDAQIVIDDSEVLRCQWDNSLQFYNLDNVTYIHENDFLGKKIFKRQYYIRKLFRLIIKNKNYMEQFRLEKKHQPFLNKNGIVYCDNGFLPTTLNKKRDVFVEGFFQSEKYFEDCRKELLKDFNPYKFDDVSLYPGIEKIKNRNTVCISIKIEHNVGSNMYSVCNKEYWEKAIAYAVNNIDNPLFFICSDDVQYVLDNLIDSNQYDCICQSKDYPVHISLAVMSLAKHFIIGNTTFGWWAQYLSTNQKKIVVAPSRWMLIDMPIDIYQENWKVIEV